MRVLLAAVRLTSNPGGLTHASLPPGWGERTAAESDVLVPALGHQQRERHVLPAELGEDPCGASGTLKNTPSRGFGSVRPERSIGAGLPFC